MVIHSSVLALRIPCTEEPGGLQSMGSQRLDVTEHAHTQKGLEELPFINDLTTSLLGSSSLGEHLHPFSLGMHLCFSSVFSFDSLKKLKRIFLQCWLVSAIQQCKSALIIHISLPSRASLSSLKHCFPIVLSYLCVVSPIINFVPFFPFFFFFFTVFPP